MIHKFFCTAFLLVSAAFAELPLISSGAARAGMRAETPAAREAARLLQSRIQQKTGVRLDARRTGIVLALPDSPALAQAGLRAPAPGELGAEGFWIGRQNGRLYLVAAQPRGFLYAAGTLLRTARYGPGSMTADPPLGLDKPVMPVRMLYLAIHCDNYYEMQPAEATIAIVEDLALWGIDGVSVWLEEAKYNDPFDPRADHADVRRKWEKEKAVLAAAQRLGLETGYVLCANEVFRGQATPDILAHAPDGPFKMAMACPSTKGGRALVLRNKDHLFRELAEAGVRLSRALIFPYDTGGCNDDRCKPWISTFLKLTEDLAGVIHRHHPDTRVYITDWHCKDDEARMIADFYNQRRPAWLAGIWKDDRHPPDRFAAVDTEILNFVEITEIGAWGTMGANPFAVRLPKLIAEMRRNRSQGFMAYSEGIYDDFNKALVARLGWNPESTGEAAARAYANWFFDAGMSEEFLRMIALMEASWTNPMGPWWELKFIQPGEAAAEAERLALSAAAKLAPAARAHWRWQVFERRARIGRLAAALREPAAFASEIRQLLAAGQREAAARRIAERQALLDAYVQAVLDLRNDVYREPAERFPAMIPDQPFMQQRTNVNVGEWRKLLAGLSAKQ
jgi:hypothetical protein